MYELIHKAVARRVTGDQKMNATSSRSHAIVRLVLEHEVDADEYDTDSINSSSTLRFQYSDSFFILFLLYWYMLTSLTFLWPSMFEYCLLYSGWESDFEHYWR